MANGLEGVVAAETILSHTDRADGMVWVRGLDLPTLVAGHGFEGTVALLWDGFAGDGLTRSSIAAALGKSNLAAELAGRLLFEEMRIAIAAYPAAPARRRCWMRSFGRGNG